MELEITGLAFGGRGVARWEGKVVFVAGALPGERVEAEVQGRHRGVLEAAVRRVLVASPWREPEVCPLALNRCGGCDLAHVAAAFRQQALKLSLAGALRGAPAELKEAVAAALFYPSPWHYRLRGTLHWQPPRELGFFAPRSHRVVSVEPCRVLSHQLVVLLPSWAETLHRAGLPAGELAFLEDLAASRRLLLYRGAKVSRLPVLAGVSGFHTPGGRGWGERELVLELPRPLWVPVGAFVQGNRFLLPQLWQLAVELVAGLGARRVVDLYGGVGFFAAAACQAGACQVVVVEHNRLAAKAAKRNLPEAQVLAVDAETAVSSGLLAGQELVILDPPRGGLSAAVREAVSSSGVPCLLYLSCDPACLARDVTYLASAGYRVRWAKLFDLFAGTHHGELAVLLQR